MGTFTTNPAKLPRVHVYRTQEARAAKSLSYREKLARLLDDREYARDESGRFAPTGDGALPHGAVVASSNDRTGFHTVELPDGKGDIQLIDPAQAAREAERRGNDPAVVADWKTLPENHLYVDAVQVQTPKQGDGTKLYKAALAFAVSRGYAGLSSKRTSRTADAGGLWAALARGGKVTQVGAYDTVTLDDLFDDVFAPAVHLRAARPVRTPDEETAWQAGGVQARTALAGLPTVHERGVVAVQASTLFGRPAATALAFALNLKTTANARQTLPLAALEPRQPLVPVAGLRAYVDKPRRDPPDVVHLVLRDGRERWVVQEGHTRIGAAKLRGAATIDARVWEFVQTEAGTFDPVPRGLHGRGLGQVALDDREYVRDDAGRFAPTGGASTGAASTGTPSIRVGRGRTTELFSPKEALLSVLHGEPANIAREDVRRLIERAGTMHEDPDLTDIGVDGMLIFGGNGLGIARADMPQIPKQDRASYVAELRREGVEVKTEWISPLALAPSQKEISARLVGEKLAKYDRDPSRPFPPLLVAKDNHILDGHHHWGMMATVAVDDPSVKIPIYRIMQPPKQALDRMHRYDREHGIARKAIDASAVNLYRVKLGRLLDAALNLPDIADVAFPGVIGAIHSDKPARKKRRGVTYRGVRLSRPPTAFEARVLSLTEIPPRLNAVKDALRVTTDLTTWPAELGGLAGYGFVEVLKELHRQGAPDRVLDTRVQVPTTRWWAALQAARTAEVVALRTAIATTLAARRLTPARVREWTADLVARRMPALQSRYAARAVNEAFALGRTAALARFRRPGTFDLARYQDDEGRFISKAEAVEEGYVLVDAVVQTAVMDENTCEECEDVDGEVMDLGDDRQLELDPPYAKCFGGDRCRCLQIGVLDNGEEIDIDELDIESMQEED